MNAYDPDALRARAAALREQAHALNLEAMRLEEMAEPPHVKLEMSYWRYGTCYRRPLDHTATVEEARALLSQLAEEDDLSPDAVWVGGARIPWEVAS